MKISRKIAVIGTVRSGKTVFLTSLINHLMEHNKMDFVINTGECVQVSNLKEKSIPKHIGKKFGYKAYRNARIGRNPQTGKAIKIPAKTVAKFKPGKKLADAVK